MGQLITLLPRHHEKWWEHVLFLLTPGSFFILPIMGLYRLMVSSGGRSLTFARRHEYRVCRRDGALGKRTKNSRFCYLLITYAKEQP